MVNNLCSVCGQAALPEELAGEPPRCPDCQRIPALMSGVTSDRPAVPDRSVPGLLPDRTRPPRSPWLAAAGILLLLSFVFVGASGALEVGDKSKIVVAILGTLGIFGALVLAMIGLQDLSRKRAQQKSIAASVSSDALDLAHRWGRTIFGGAARLAGICCIISIVLALTSGIPLMGLAMCVGLSLFIGLLAAILYLVVVGPRVAYFTLARYFGRGRLPLPGKEVQAKVSALQEVDPAQRPETHSEQMQAPPHEPPQDGFRP